MIKINFKKAQEITKDRLREERSPLLTQNDKEYMIAVKEGLDTGSLAEERQRLLDVTKLVDSATTLVDLKEISV